jgi:uncharacterized protein
MLIDIDKLPKDGLKISRDFEFTNSELIDENVVFLQLVHADVSARKIGDEEVRIQGRIKTCLSFVCSRCLTPFEYPVNSKFDLVFLPEELHELQDELDDEDLDQLFYKDRQIDLREVILEQLNLTFPAKPLCAEGCEGICAVCGRIRRRGECGCQGKEAEGRLDQLKIFLKDKR